MSWSDKAVSPVVFTPAAADASWMTLDGGLMVRDGKLMKATAFQYFKMIITQLPDHAQAEIKLFRSGVLLPTPAAVTSKTNVSGYPPSNIFDGSLTTNTALNDATLPQWLAWNYTEPKPVDMMELYTHTSLPTSRYIRDFTLYGSNTGSFSGEELLIVSVTNLAYEAVGGVTNKKAVVYL